MSWRDKILNDFVPQVSKLTLVADPDNLLTEEKLALELRKRGFDLIEFTDSVEFRYAYESKYRSIWDKGEHTDLVVVLRLEGVELNSLPYDLLKSGRRLSFDLGELFPNLSYPVVEALESSWLDPLYTAQDTLEADRLGDNATKDFVLRHVFGIADELIRDEVELLRTLLRVHYGAIQVPEILAERLVQLLLMNSRFNNWPLELLVRDASSFFDFLQERWPRFLKKHQKRDRIKEETFEYELRYEGPVDLPFDHQDIRVAMVVLDGMAIDQWVSIRKVLHKQDARLLFREAATFAWIPTMTPVSRQALFGAKPPMFFPASINTTNNDEKVWKQFWESCGLSKHDVTYLRGLRSGDPISALESVIHPGKTRVVGLVVDMVDKMAHRSLLGSAGLHNQVKQWAETGYLHKLITRLLDLQFDVWLTSDHGNTECVGKGRPAEGVIADMRGERVRVYPTEDLRSKVAEKFPFSKPWSPIGLPPEYLPLMAGGRNAFVTEGESIVAHGGLAIEEVIVPLAYLGRSRERLNFVSRCVAQLPPEQS